MLYKIDLQNTLKSRLEPLPFLDLSNIGKLEKDLENLIAAHLLDILFEDSPLMPIYQERIGKSEADLYALNKDGDLFIFELKRARAGSNAIQQLLKYVQYAGQWTFTQLAEKYTIYMKTKDPSNIDIDLQKAHQSAFQLNPILPIKEFNRRQQMTIIGSAADNELMRAVDYWSKQGLRINFIPYRIYRLGNELYFEFFSPPYDHHSNPNHKKGVLFDTNRTDSETDVWEMLEKKRVSAYGNACYFVEYLNSGDIVFYSHKNLGVIAAAEVIGPTKQDSPGEKYRDVRFLTSIPIRAEGLKKAMSFADVSATTGKSFFWARTLKVPYLTCQEATTLLKALKEKLRAC